MKNPAGMVDDAFAFIYISTGLILVFVTALMLWLVYRYRRSRNPVATQIRGHALLELAWTVLPTLLALVMFWYGWESYLGLRNVPANAIAIMGEARKFSWTFEYPNGKFSDNLLVVPEGKAIRVNLKSGDVVHGFFVPAFRLKMDVIPGRQTYGWFLADKLGEYDIYCSVYCGAGHAEMLAKLRVIPEPEYNKWVAEKDDDF